MHSATLKTDAKYPLKFYHSQIRNKLKNLSYSTNNSHINPREISLKSKHKSITSKSHQGENLSLIGNYVNNDSDENILKTPSTVNENPPLSLDLLDQSLTKYYQSEVNRDELKKTSYTPAPTLPEVKIKEKPIRSTTPKVNESEQRRNQKLPQVVRDRFKSQQRSNKISKKFSKDSTAKAKIRYFSRRERKSKSPDSRKYVYYYFN